MGISEEGDERMGSVIPVQELKNKTGFPDAKLERGDGVLFPGKTGVPLDVEADDEVVEDEAVVVDNLAHPLINLGGSLRHGIIISPPTNSKFWKSFQLSIKIKRCV
nr:uncharacterized protein A4U43_C04F4570 [Ipomoea batatas]